MTCWLPELISLYWHLILDMLSLDTWYVTLDMWHPILDMLSLDTDIWHLISDSWYLTCYHLIPDTWHLISNTWQLTCYHLIHDTCYFVLIYLTWCSDTWLELLHLTPVLHCLFMIITFTGTLHDYYTATRHLVLMYFWTPVLLNSCIPCTDIPSTVTLVNSMVILASGRACSLVSGWRGCIPWSC